MDTPRFPVSLLKSREELGQSNRELQCLSRCHRECERNRGRWRPYCRSCHHEPEDGTQQQRGRQTRCEQPLDPTIRWSLLRAGVPRPDNDTLNLDIMPTLSVLQPGSVLIMQPRSMWQCRLWLNRPVRSSLGPTQGHPFLVQRQQRGQCCGQLQAAHSQNVSQQHTPQIAKQILLPVLFSSPTLSPPAHSSPLLVLPSPSPVSPRQGEECKLTMRARRDRGAIVLSRRCKEVVRLPAAHDLHRNPKQDPRIRLLLKLRQSCKRA